MRLKTEIWVAAHIRLAVSQGAMATVISKGDGDAGAIFIQTLNGEGEARLFGPTHADDCAEFGERYWRVLLDQPAIAPWDQEETPPIADYLARQCRFDPDFWVVEIEDREGRHFLGDRLIGE